MSERADRVVRSRNAVIDGRLREAAVVVRDGRIAAIEPYAAPLEASRDEDFGHCWLLPGLVDTHVHVNEPGRSEWEGFATATRAAAAGGITTIVDMPLNSIPPTVDLPGLEAKRAAAAGKLWVDVALWGGVVPGNTSSLAPLFARGLPGFKCFLVPSGVDEFPHVQEHDLLDALPVIAELGAVLLVHAEAPGPIERAEARLRAESRDPRRYATYLDSRPPEAETEAIELLVSLARRTGARIHIVHFACGDAVEVLAGAKAEGLRITAETCPHYLYFEAERIADGATAFKCAPPIREKRHQDALRQALQSGVIDTLVSDHSPCVPELKRIGSGDFVQAWGGIASLQLGLAIASSLGPAAGFDAASIALWMSERPARLAGLASRKGSIAPGRDADLVVFDPEREWVVRGRELLQRHPVTPYEGHTLRGQVRRTYLRGSLVFDAGQLGQGPAGALLEAAEV